MFKESDRKRTFAQFTDAQLRALHAGLLFMGIHSKTGTPSLHSFTSRALCNLVGDELTARAVPYDADAQAICEKLLTHRDCKNDRRYAIEAFPLIFQMTAYLLKHNIGLPVEEAFLMMAEAEEHGLQFTTKPIGHANDTGSEADPLGPDALGLDALDRLLADAKDEPTPSALDSRRRRMFGEDSK